MSDVPAWIVELRARAKATEARIAERVREEVALSKERIAALEWCRANGNPHLTAATHASPGVSGTKPIAPVAGVGRDLEP